MIIDHKAKLRIPDIEVDQYENELQALQRLSVGLHYLDGEVSRLENEVAAKLPCGDYEIFGNHPAFEGISMDLVACFFHWYSVTVCDYARLVGWLGHDEHKIKTREYVEGVLPEVYKWRNKIGAHFVRSQPNYQDNIADQYLSVMDPLEYHSGAFYVGSAVLAVISDEVKAVSQQSMMWSLTKTHRSLIPRYWPTAKDDETI